VRAFWRIVCRVVLWVRVVSAFLLRSIRICLMVALIDWWRREVSATWVWSLRLVVANSAVWRRRVVTAIFIGCIRLTVFFVAASFFAGITLALPVLVIRIASSTHSASSESGFC
jgi:hypothetical protein